MSNRPVLIAVAISVGQRGATVPVEGITSAAIARKVTTEWVAT